MAPTEQIAFLADGHLTGEDPERIDTLVATLDRLGGRCRAVFILGDLFEVWLGLDRAPAHVARVGEALRRLRARGVRTGYVEGNRDFAIGRGATAGLFDVVAEREHVERFGELTFHLAHGDLVNPRDWPYRSWRRLAKGALAPIGLRLLPAATAQRLAERLETRLRSSNRYHKSYFPEADCLAWAADRVAAGADWALVGHFHREVEREVEGGGRRGRFLALPFWHDEPRPVVFDRRGRVE